MPVHLRLPGRSLVLVAGMPGAGKSTALATLPRLPGLVVLDPDAPRAALDRVLPRVPYRAYRALVHAWHRLAILAAACSPAPTVVVHLPATDARTRRAVALLAAATGRGAHLVWLDVPAVRARQGQLARGRLTPATEFAAHAARAAATTAALREHPPAGFAAVTVLDRAAAARGLRLEPVAADGPR
jgi:predicted kinase